jgi:hypothetical protein
MPRFSSPDQDQDKQFLAEEAERKGYDWKNVFWKPKPSKKGDEVDNVIRIMPARGTSAATYHMKIGKHFIKHSDNDYETFVCLSETYGKPCPACEEAQRIYAEAKTMSKEQGDRHRKQATKFNIKRLGVFNVIDRLAYQDYKEGRQEKLPKVLLWEAPRKLGWERIVRNVSSRGRTWNLFDQYDEAGNVTKPGRDVLVKFYPESEPATMYDIQYLDPQPLGTDEEVAIWYEQIIDLLPNLISIYNEIPYEEARIKCFGSKDEREALKAEKQRMREETAAARQEAAAEEEAALSEEEREALGAPSEEKETPAPAAAKPAPAAARTSVPPARPVPGRPAPVPAAAKPATSDDAALKAKIAEVKARMAKGGK